MHDKPQTFLTVVDKTSVHRQVLHGVAICVRSFEFTTGAVCSFDNKSWIISHNMLWTYLAVMAKTKLKLSCIKRTTYKRKSISDHTPSKRLKTFLPRIISTLVKRSHPPSTTKTNPGSTTHKSSRKKITVGRTPSKQTAKQRGRRELFSPGPEPEADSDTSDADETLQYDSMYNTYVNANIILNENNLNGFLDRLTSAIVSEVLPLDNVCFRLFVDVLHFLSERDSRQFRYQKETLVWWFVLLKQHGEQLLCTYGGMKFLGSCTDEDSTVMKLTSAQINFIVPTPSILWKLKPTTLDVCKPRMPGIFQDVLYVTKKGESISYNLQFDGKLLKVGLTEKHGDIDCLGEEPQPTLEQRRMLHDRDINQLATTGDMFLTAWRQFNEHGVIPSPMRFCSNVGCGSSPKQSISPCFSVRPTLSSLPSNCRL